MFVPKIVAVFIVLLIALPFAGAAMSGLMTDIAAPYRGLLRPIHVMHVHLPALSGIVLTYLLVFSRVGAMVMLLPAIGQHGRAVARAAGAGAGDFACADPQVQAHYPARGAANDVALVILIAQEVTAGVLVGAMARIIMSALQVAGFLIATQIGLAYAQTIDPTQNTQGAVVGNFMSLLGTAADFRHQPASSGDRRHRRQLPHAAAGRPSAHRRHGAAGDPARPPSSFALGFQLAAPFLVFGFAVYAGLGVLARLMPQLQIFFVAMPINIMCGFVIMLALMGSLITVFLNYYTTSMGAFL